MSLTHIILIFILILCLGSVKADNIKIYQAEEGKELSLPQLAEELILNDVIFLGEYHGDQVLHNFEAELFTILSQKSHEMILSLEMLERDNQQELDNYLRGKIDYETFSEQVRLWPNHRSDYQPLLQIAIQYKRDVIAANVPRRYASLVGQKGEEGLQSLTNRERRYIAKELKALEGDYKQAFYRTMERMQNHLPKSDSSSDRIHNIYKAQALKDDTMAESINDYLLANPQKKVLHINGDFHSRKHLGTAEKLALLNEDIKIVVISPVLLPEEQELGWDDSFKHEGDYLIIYKKKLRKMINEEVNFNDISTNNFCFITS